MNYYPKTLFQMGNFFVQPCTGYKYLPAWEKHHRFFSKNYLASLDYQQKKITILQDLTTIVHSLVRTYWQCSYCTVVVRLVVILINLKLVWCLVKSSRPFYVINYNMRGFVQSQMSTKSVVSSGSTKTTHGFVFSPFTLVSSSRLTIAVYDSC